VGLIILHIFDVKEKKSINQSHMQRWNSRFLNGILSPKTKGIKLKIILAKEKYIIFWRDIMKKLK